MARTTTDLAEVLLQVQAKLIASLDWPKSRVQISLVGVDEEIVAAAPSERFIVIMPQTGTFDQGLAQGAGREAVGNDGQIDVSLFARIMVDRVATDVNYLTHATLGVLATWKQIVNALHMYDPVTIADPETDLILEEPMRGLRWVNHPRRGQSHWGKISSTWETKFLQALS